MPATLTRGVLLLMLASAGSASAAQAPRVAVETGATAQSYTSGGTTVSEVTVPLGASVTLAPGVAVSLRTAYATASADGLEDLSGLTDTQIGARYSRPVGGGLVDLSLTTSLPTGQGTLTREQFATAAAISLDDYAFVTPSFGRGLVVSPGLAVAVPLGTRAALGVGAAYSLASAYTLLDGDPESYAPGNETILTAGLDASLGGASTFTLEGSYVLYGDDTYRNVTFSPGDKVSGSLRLALGGGAVRGRFQARYRQVADGELSLGQRSGPIGYIRPTQATVGLGLDLVQRAFDIGLSGGLRYYGSLENATSAEDFATSLDDQQLLLDVRLAPTVRLGRTAAVQASYTYTRGVAEAAGAPELTGYRAGGRLRVEF